MVGVFSSVKLEIIKRDGNGSNRLSGAEFQLRNKDYVECTDKITTGSDGKCTFTINAPGTYYIYETKTPKGYDIKEQINYDRDRGSSYRGYIRVNPDGSYYASYYGTLNSNSEHNLSISIYNTKKLGGFELTKRDSYDKSPLSGVWLFITKGNETINWGNYKTCYDWDTTNSSGKKSFQNLEKGRYYVWELNQLTGYYDKFQYVGYVDVEAGNTNCSLQKGTKNGYIYCEGNTIYNKQYRSLQILKIDIDTKKPISNIGFKVYSHVENQWIHMDETTLSYTNSYTLATVFKTGSNGLTNEIKNLPLGEYDIYEVNLGSSNNIYKLDYIDNVPFLPGETVKTNATKKTCTLSRIKNGEPVLRKYLWENKQVYVTLSGRVWVDKQPSKDSRRNDLYKTNSTNYTDYKDTELDGVNVMLKKTDGSVVMTTTTANGGRYTFYQVLTEPLIKGEYYIEFEYDGLKYTNVTPKTDNGAGSKAQEKSTDRTAFNNNFSVIEGGENKSGTKNANYGYTKDANGNKKYDLTYTKTDYKSTLNNSGTLTIRADTSSAGYYLKNDFTYGNPNTEKVTEIKNINLGLYEREQPDIAIVQDIQNVKVSVNNYWHTYNYASRFKDSSSTEDIYDIAVKFGEKYGNKTYSRAVYEADIKYTDTDANNEIKVYITYKITIKNQAARLKALVYGINDYFDSNYEIYRVGSELEDNGNIATTNNKIRYETATTYNANYKKTMIYEVNNYNNRSHMLIEPQNAKDIYIQFKLNRTAINKIVTNKEVLNNVAAIKSYSSRDMVGWTYAGIDIDSNPNNCTPGEKSTYEDDTDYAPGFELLITNPRRITGTVFLDSTTGELKTGEIRQGDGEYIKDEETGIENVVVTMVKSDGTSAQIYDEEKWRDAADTTNRFGIYVIDGFVPGEYYLVFRWGDKTYKVQDYKGTIQNKEFLVANSDNLEWYKEKEPRYSDAQDDWSSRVAIDDQTRIMNNSNREAINKYNNAKITKTNMVQEDLITKMNSTTLPFRVNLEYNTEATNSIDEYELNENGAIKMNGLYAVKKAGYKNEIKNIDFGIVERARQILQLEKIIKSAKVTLASQSVLINVQLNEKGEIINKPQYVTYVPKSDGAEALMKFEIDQELVQGATLEIEYGFKISNISELDYTTQAFYKYGIVPADQQNKMVKITPINVIDYLDNNVSVDMKQIEGKWTLLENADSIQRLNDLGLLSQDATNYAKQNLKNGNIKVLEKTGMPTPLTPIDNTDTADVNESTMESNLKCSKLLAESDTTVLENYAEIINVEKIGGATLQTTPGNYIPKDAGTSEVDNANTGTLEIIPPTGIDKNIIAYTLLAISSLGILGSGIILIKKYVIA